MGDHSRLLSGQGPNTGDTMINEIILDRHYVKFPTRLNSGDDVYLLEVLNAKFEDLSPKFICIDTSTFDGDNYKLPKTGDALVLFLLYKTELFTTIRTHSPVREHEYRSLRGSWLKVKIENEK